MYNRELVTISHHYFDVNEEALFIVCDKHIGILSITIEQMIHDLA